MAQFTHLTPPTEGTPITRRNGQLVVPSDPIIPFIEGDGTGPDIWRASQRVFDAAVAKAYGGARRVVWFEVLAGEKAKNLTNEWLPNDTLEAVKTYRVAIKGPLTTPVGGGIRSLNVTLRQVLDLYACVRPVRYFTGTPSPVTHPELMNVVIFRENTEDVYAGIEFARGTPQCEKLIEFLRREMGKNVAPDSGIGIKPMSETGTQAARAHGHPVRAREQPAGRHPGAQGQHHEVHRGRVPRLGLRGGEGGVPRPHRHGGRGLERRVGRGQAPHQRSHRRQRVPADPHAHRPITTCSRRRT